MTNRTIKTYGMGVGETPAEIVVTANGQQVYSGTVPTVSTLSREEEDQQFLFGFELPLETNGTVPMSYQVSTGTVLFAYMTTNYVEVPNPIFTQEQIAILLDTESTSDSLISIYEEVGGIPFTQEEKDLFQAADVTAVDSLLSTKNLSTYVSGGDSYFKLFQDIDGDDQRSSVYIDGELQLPDRVTFQRNGTWFWLVDEGSIMTFDMEITAGIE